MNELFLISGPRPQVDEVLAYSANLTEVQKLQVRPELFPSSVYLLTCQQRAPGMWHASKRDPCLCSWCQRQHERRCLRPVALPT